MKFWADVTPEDEAVVDNLVPLIPPDELAGRAVKEAILAKLTAALAAGIARDALLVSLANMLLLIAILAFK